MVSQRIYRNERINTKGVRQMSQVELNLVKYANEIAKTKELFIHHIKLIFTIKRLCKILEINRNRYNYLIRENKLDQEIGKLYEHDLYIADLVKGDSNE